MKKSIVRGSMLTVAALSVMLGGTSYTTNVKETVRETPAIISKAIQNSVATAETISKGIAVQDVSMAETPVVEETTQQPVEEPQAQIEEKEAKIESNQVVANIDSYLNIRSEASEDSNVVGKFYTGNVGTIVEQGDEWSVVSSGNAYGYVKNEYLLFGADAEEYIENNCDRVAKVTAETLNIRAEESTDSEVITLSDEGDTLTVLGRENEWFKVALADEQVGYVSGEYVCIDYIYETAVTIEEEEAAIAAAEAQAAAEAAAEQEQAAQNQQTTQTTESSSSNGGTTDNTPKQKETVDSTKVNVSDDGGSKETVQQESSNVSGQAVADFAVQYVGNPYVYGGSSLTKGADCSGFVMAVYAHFGYSLPHNAASQSGYGTSVSIKNLQPGDLLFYHNFGHVAIYIGGGQVVHASNEKTGIKISNYDYSSIDKAVRIIN
ncbi:MAG: C40 family peptidase [Lachnospiraceae bacterium]|nr:C40 family peptidase [Lachnospiraceae bacterium]